MFPAMDNVVDAWKAAAFFTLAAMLVSAEVWNATVDELMY